VKNSVYALPHTPQAREDFEWLQAEVAALKGQATLFAADSVDTLSRAELVAAFRKPRAEEFEAIRRAAEKLMSQEPSAGGATRLRRRRLQHLSRRLRERWSQTTALDFFGAPGREQAASSLERLERHWQHLGARSEPPPEPDQPLAAGRFRRRTWITRPRPGVDRMASAWLIRNFIDPRARFRFAERPPAPSSSVPFDMFGVEFGHQGNACSFEVLARRFGISDPAVLWIGRIVHLLDLKEPADQLPESSAIGRLIEGLRLMHRGDQELLEHGMELFEALFRSYGGGGRSRLHGNVARRRANKTARNIGGGGGQSPTVSRATRKR